VQGRHMGGDAVHRRTAARTRAHDYTSSGPLGHALESDVGDGLGNRRLGTAEVPGDIATGRLGTAEVPGDIATGNDNANAIKDVGLGGTRETGMVSPLYVREYTPQVSAACLACMRVCRKVFPNLCLTKLWSKSPPHPASASTRSGRPCTRSGSAATSGNRSVKRTGPNYIHMRATGQWHMARVA
jgi:hypothetical protein